MKGLRRIRRGLGAALLLVLCWGLGALEPEDVVLGNLSLQEFDGVRFQEEALLETSSSGVRRYRVSWEGMWR